VGTMWEKQGDAAKALQYRWRGHKIFEQLTASDPQNTLARKNFAFSDESLGQSLIAVGKTREGLQHLREGLAAFEAMTANASNDRYVSSGLAESYFQLGMAYSRLATTARASSDQSKKDWHEARSWFQKSSDILAAKNAQGTLDNGEREKEERVFREIARCNAKLTESAGSVMGREP